HVEWLEMAAGKTESIDDRGCDFILGRGTHRQDDRQFSTLVERLLDPVDEIEGKTEIEIRGVFDHAELEIRIGMLGDLLLGDAAHALERIDVAKRNELRQVISKSHAAPLGIHALTPWSGWAMQEFSLTPRPKLIFSFSVSRA